MQFMISHNKSGFKDTSNFRMTEFVRLKKDTQLQKKDRKITQPPPPTKRPPPPPKIQMQKQKVNMVQPKMDMPNLDIPLQTERFKGSVMGNLSIGADKISTNIIPLVRTPPRYPVRAANRRIQGWVKVEFTITKTGTVSNAIIVEAQPPNTFDRAALTAIRKWKFKEKIIDGEAIEQRALQILEFKLSR